MQISVDGAPRSEVVAFLGVIGSLSCKVSYSVITSVPFISL